MAAAGDGYRVEASFILWEGGDILHLASAVFRDGEGCWAVLPWNKAVRSSDTQVDSAPAQSGLQPGDSVISHPDDRVRRSTHGRHDNCAKHTVNNSPQASFDGHAFESQGFLGLSTPVPRAGGGKPAVTKGHDMQQRGEFAVVFGRMRITCSHLRFRCGCRNQPAHRVRRRAHALRAGCS